MSRIYGSATDCAADPGHTRIKVDLATFRANTVALPSTGERTPFHDDEEPGEWGHCDWCQSTLIYVYPKKEAA